MRSAALLALLGLTVACRSEIQLGGPDSGAAPAPTSTGVVPARCTGGPTREVVGTTEPWGEIRAIAAGSSTLYALFAQPGTNEGVLTRVPTSGGVLTQVARVGLDPAALALSADGSFVFVASRGSGQVLRVDSLGTAVVADARGAPSAITADDRAGALWTVPANDSVVAWDFMTGAPAVLTTSPRAAAVVRDAGALFITGDGTVRAFVPGLDAAPRQIGTGCDAGAPAIDGPRLYCAGSGGIQRIDLTTGSSVVVAATQPGARDVVAGGGRVFWRAAPRPGQTLVMTLPLDGIGGPTVFESGGAGPLLIAAEGCHLYFTAGSSLVRRGL